MKKFWLLPLLLITLLAMPSAAKAQGIVTVLQTLRVEIWPDYDQPAALFLLTGSLPIGTPLPATVTIPLPDRADLNAVARITADSVLIDDIPFSQNNGELTFTTPDLGFRVEYYLPFEATGDATRQFRFGWQSPVEILQLVVDVQQPRAATSFTLDPPAVNVTANETDGLTYHTIPVMVVPANVQRPRSGNGSQKLPNLAGQWLQPANFAPNAASRSSPATSSAATVERPLSSDQDFMPVLQMRGV